MAALYTIISAASTFVAISASWNCVFWNWPIVRPNCFLSFTYAIVVSKALDLALTGKNAGAKERVPMCGVPFHSASGYIQKLVDNGHKVAIVEQLTDPGKKGIVERGVVQIVTPGTIFDESMTKNKNNYIACMMIFDFVYTLAFCDITTGEFQVVNIDKKDHLLNNQLASMEVKEIVVKSDCIAVRKMCDQQRISLF
mgnify:CR=1 FL=1